MASTTDRAPGGHGLGSTAFLLAQLGAHAAQRFADRLAAVQLTPAEAGLLRAVAREPGRSQQALAAQLSTPPTRLVGLVDGLERRGVVERRRNPADRRLNEVLLTDAGRDLMRRLGQIATAHDRDVTAALTQPESEQLHALLARVAEEQQLTPGTHPGYRGTGTD